jgi:hypothetical protein
MEAIRMCSSSSKSSRWRFRSDQEREGEEEAVGGPYGE